MGVYIGHECVGYVCVCGQWHGGGGGGRERQADIKTDANKSIVVYLVVSLLFSFSAFCGIWLFSVATLPCGQFCWCAVATSRMSCQLPFLLPSVPFLLTAAARLASGIIRLCVISSSWGGRSLSFTYISRITWNHSKIKWAELYLLATYNYVFAWCTETERYYFWWIKPNELGQCTLGIMNTCLRPYPL